MKISSKFNHAVLVSISFVAFSSLAAPGGVSSPGLWLKSDDAGDISTAWKDHSDNNNPVEAVADSGEAPWELTAADSDHNFHPYTTGYSSNRLFLEADASFVVDEKSPTPLTILTVTRNESVLADDVTARITGLDNLNYGSSSPAREPGISLMGMDTENPGQLQISLESDDFFGISEYRYSNSIPLSQNLLSHSVIGGANNDQVTFGFNGIESLSVMDDPVITRGNVLSVGYGAVLMSEAFNGDIMEVIWYAEALTPEQLRKANTYLAIKYGIALEGDYVGSNDQVVWSAAESASFNHSVFGLARDDISGLHQKVSRSVDSSELILSIDADFSSDNGSISRVTEISGDQQYFIVGDNAAAVATQDTELETPYSLRLSREWLVQSTSYNQPVSLKFELPTLPANTRVYLVRKNSNSDFSDGSESLGEVDSSTGIIENIQLNDGDYFTLAITRDTDGDGVLDTEDAFPNDPTESVDTDSDGTGNNADTDDDNDTYTDDDEIASGSDPLDSGDTPLDNDGDSISDVTDTDDDNDGVSDIDEIAIGIDPFNADSDGDGVYDGREVGADASMPIDTNGDGIPDVKDEFNDSDLDGLTNFIESQIIGSNPNLRDSDGDDLRDNEELAVPLLGEDTNGNGIDDAIDASMISAPDTNGDGIVDFALRDTDGDGTPDLLDFDSDADGIDDVNEALADTDKDGIIDVLDPFIALGGGDSDADGIPDVVECCSDTDLDGQPDYTQLDSDRDGLSDRQEAGLIGNDDDVDGYDDFYDADINFDGIIDNSPDDNGDGIRDTWVVLDTDGDGFADYRDTDSDNDGISDFDETLSASDFNIDEDNDGIPAQADVASGVDGGMDGGDSDGDGLSDLFECAAGYPFCKDSDFNGTPNYMSTDSDGDGIDDSVECPSVNDCPDSDGDGIPDYIDNDSDKNQAPGTATGDNLTGESKSDHMTASTGIGALTWVWVLGMMMLLSYRRKTKG